MRNEYLTLICILFLCAIALPAQEPDFVQLQTMIERGDWAGAEAELDRLESIVGDSAELREYRVRVLSGKSGTEYNAGRLPESSRFGRTADKVRYAPIRKLIEGKKLDAAQRELSDLPLEERASPPVKLLQAELWVNRGEQHFQRNRPRRAFEYYSKAYNIWPNHPLVSSRYFQLRDRLRGKRPPRKRSPAAAKKTESAPEPVAEPDPVSEPEQRDPSSAGGGKTINVYLMEGDRADLLGQIENSLPRRAPAEADPLSRALLAGILFALILLNLQILYLSRNRREP